MTMNELTPLRSSYAEYLPAPLQIDPFIGRFLLIIESVLNPIEHTIDTVANYFDPSITPSALLPLLAGWVNEDLDQHWPERCSRALLAQSALLQRWRGTRRALRARLSLYTGQVPLIVENWSGLRLGPDAVLGLNTQLGLPCPSTVAITLTADATSPVDEPLVRRIIENELPAGLSYTLEIRQRASILALTGGDS